MNVKQEAEFKDLLGEHILDAVDCFSEQVLQYGSHYEDASHIRFRLNGTVYTAVEDPSDGYRSSLERLFISKDEMQNVFPPVRVVAKMKGNEGGYVNNTLQFIACETGKIVLEVGTDNEDDYYPWFVGSFFPENMPVNEGAR